MLYLNNCANYNLFNGANQLRSNVYEEDNQYYLSVEVAGFDKDEIKIDFDDDVLTINASKKEDNKTKYLINEFNTKNVTRSYYFENVDVDSISAKLEDGILYINLKKKEIVDNKKIIAIE